MKYTIEQKMSGTGSINDISSDLCDRVIEFGSGCKYAVVLAAYYGGKGYTTHKTEGATIAASRRSKDYAYKIIDDQGREYAVDYDKLVAL